MKKTTKGAATQRAKRPGRGTSYGARKSAEAWITKDRPVRKNYYLHQSKINMVKELLQAKTETEAIEGALDILIYGEALARGTESMAGEEYHDVLGIADEAPGAKA